MKNNKLFLLLFSLGLFCIIFAGLSLYLSLNPSILKPQIQYEIGSVVSLDGSVKKTTLTSEATTVKSGQKVYSKERFTLGPDAAATFELSGEEISFSGPTDVTFEVISPETKKVFVNFSKFDEITPKTSFENLILTYKGWVIEPYFKKSDLEDSTPHDITMPAISEDSSPEDVLDKESLLDELIASKRSLLKKCYENYLRKNPMATGKLVVEFTLQNSG
ncbi:MAG: hypothetical protein ACRBBP_09790, partial [Bdellovibrionales bacterium]